MKKFIISLLFFSNNLLANAIGFYTKGALTNSVDITKEGQEISKLFLDRKKLYTTQEMADLLSLLAREVQERSSNSEALQVGDLSGKKGGEARRHVSHQNGLDADVVYLRVNREEQDASDTEWAEYFTKNQRLSSNFDLKRNWEVFEYLAHNFSVGRIFVDRAVKLAYCKLAEKRFGTTEDPLMVKTLRRLRVAKYHKTHFHIRLECPPGHIACIEQSSPPRGSGCDNVNLIEEIQQC